MAKDQFRFSGGKQLFIIQTELSSALRVESRTVRDWIKKGWLTPRYRLLGGRLQAVFSTEEVEAFADWYLPTLEGLNAPCERGSRHDRINSLRAKGRRCANKASQTAMNKRLGDGDGNTQTEQDEDDDPETDYQEPIPLDHKSIWRRSDLAHPPSGFDRGLTDEGRQDQDWNDDMEPER